MWGRRVTCGGWRGRQRPGSLGLYQVPRGGLCRKSFIKKIPFPAVQGGKQELSQERRLGAAVEVQGETMGLECLGVEAKCTGWRAGLLWSGNQQDSAGLVQAVIEGGLGVSNRVC